MHYSIESRDRIYVKGYEFSSFPKSISTHANKVAKNMSNKYSQKLLDNAKKSTTNAIKTASKTAIQKPAEVAGGDLTRNKTADKITSISKSPKELHSQNAPKELHLKTDENEIEIPKETYISPEKRQQIIDELKWV